MIDWKKTAFVFPGQASQQVGMGADLAHTYPRARAVYDEADKLLDFPLSELCWEGPEEALTDTINAQPALYVTGIAVLRVIQSAFEQRAGPGAAVPSHMAGHSLGEITALVAAGALSFADGLHLVRERGRLMKDAGRTHPGGMAAVIGLMDSAAVTAACDRAAQETGAPAVLANDNAPGQVVISGDAGALERAMELLKEAGAKRLIRLNVSAAFHSPLMEDIADAFAGHLMSVQFRKPAVPVIGNVTAAPLINAESIRVELAAQLTARVRWTESVQAMRAAGVETFIEIGAKDVLTGLLRRIDRKAQGIALNSAESVRAFIAEHSADL
ncbi:MAG: ACP S-malonyltransferase [Anaerolineae bacterium]|nr:ACP S-malonyltransferase [Anaerolineae bacterium]